MARMTGKFKCPGCTFDTKIGFTHPGVIGAEIFDFICETCRSTVQVRCKRAKNGQRGGVQYDAKVTRPSLTLRLIMQEEAEQKASSPT